jgi:5'-deoxynucleotidase YfbR-like HD superfamily hydrolase
MKYVSDLRKYIKDCLDIPYITFDSRQTIIEALAKEILRDNEMIFLMLAMDSYTTDEANIRQRMDEIMSVREKNNKRPKLKPLPDGEWIKKDTKNIPLDPESFGDSDFPDDWGPIATPEQEALLKSLDQLGAARDKPGGVWTVGEGLTSGFDHNAAWIQTYSGRRFNPMKPNPKAIVIQDVAHALSMQCRFNGHCKEFYSVAQHCVLVSHMCGEDALWGLLHDASEAYLVDIPRPLKHSGKFQAYLEMEEIMQRAICERFGLSLVEPASVKRADKILLSTEARDLMSPLHKDWRQPAEPLPFTITSWSPKEAEEKFIQRFDKLMAALLLDVILIKK